MKIFKLFFLITIASTMVACSSDDDSTNQNQDDEVTASIVNDWILTEHSLIINETETYPDGSTIETLGEGEGFNLDVIVKFSENPNITTNQGTYDMNLTITVENNAPFTVTNENLNFNHFIGNWTLEDNQLTITSIANVITGPITELTENSLAFNLNFIENYMEGDVAIENDIQSFFVFTKQ